MDRNDMGPPHEFRDVRLAYTQPPLHRFNTIHLFRKQCSYGVVDLTPRLSDRHRCCRCGRSTKDVVRTPLHRSDDELSVKF